MRRQTFFSVTEEEPVEAHAAASKRLRVAAERSIYDYPLSGGLLLGDATAAILQIESDMHESFEKGNGRQKLWYRAVRKQLLLAARKAKKDKAEATVRDHVGEEKIRDLRLKAESK